MNTDVKISELFKALDATALVNLTTIIISAVLLIFVLQRVLRWIANRVHGRYHFFLLALVPTLRLLILIVAFFMIVPQLIEPSLQNMVAILGAAGLALGFALKDYVSSLIAGVVSVIELEYRPGDWIQMNNVYGEVIHVGMRTVKIVTPDDTMVSIPHLTLWKEPIHNANNGSPSLQCVTNFYLHPEHDAKLVRQILYDVALTSPYVKLTKPIAVMVQEKPWGTHYVLRAYPVDPRQQFNFAADLTVRGKKKLLEMGARPCALPVSAMET